MIPDAQAKSLVDVPPQRTAFAVRQPRLTADQVESAVRAAARGGIRVLRVTVDHEWGRIEIEAASEDALPLRSFDSWPQGPRDGCEIRGRHPAGAARANRAAAQNFRERRRRRSMIHHGTTPPPGPLPLARWGSREIAAFFCTAPRIGPLPDPGVNRHRLIFEDSSVNISTAADNTDWTGTSTCNHRRDVGVQAANPELGFGDLDTNQRRILRLLAGLDEKQLPDGTILRMCVNRRRLKASAEAMQDLYRMGLVNGAGSRDAWGTGNTPHSSWWWLTGAGLRLVAKAGSVAR